MTSDKNLPSTSAKRLTIGALPLLLFISSMTLEPHEAGSGRAHAQETASSVAFDGGFPDGISPSHVYAKMVLLDESLNKLIDALNVPVPAHPQAIESELQPMHVYQIVLTCTWRLQELDDRQGVQPLPYISTQPRVYAPRDVMFIVALMLDNVRRIGSKLELTEMPTEETVVSDKVPTDVYNRAIDVFVKLNALCEYDDISPNEVYAQMIRADEDVRSILRQADPACRYNVKPQQNTQSREPSDVFHKCLDIRLLINQHRQALGMPTIPLPTPPDGTIRPRDVFFQTQIIIAELNLLKMRLNTVSSTPLAIPVTDKSPTKVYQAAMMVEHLLKQVKTGEDE